MKNRTKPIVHMLEEIGVGRQYFVIEYSLEDGDSQKRRFQAGRLDFDKLNQGRPFTAEEIARRLICADGVLLAGSWTLRWPLNSLADAQACARRTFERSKRAVRWY